jgi:hypothetical protein
MLISKATPDQFQNRIAGGVEQLADAGIFGLDAYKEMVSLLEGRGLANLHGSDLLRVEAALRSVVDRYGAYSSPSIERGAMGRPLPAFGAKFKILAFTDCVGQDPETASRIAIEEGSALFHLGINGVQQWQQTEPLNPAHIRGTITSTYLSYLDKLINEPHEQTEQLVLLANAAPRDPNNPDAKGCPFVVAILEGNVIYIGTLNHGGIELQGIKPHVKELWHTTLGVEETGVEGGSAPKSVFRSKHLLSLFRELHKGNELLLDRPLDIESNIHPIVGIQIDSRDSFGNLKTTESFRKILEELSLRIGDKILLSVGNVQVEARIATSHGDGKPGEVLLVPGSSPLSILDESDTRADIVINSADASAKFICPNDPFVGRVWAGKKVTISPLAN